MSRDMRKRLIIWTLGLAAAHFIIMLASLLLAYGSGMEEFDNPDYQPTVVERVAEAICPVLMQPAASLWTPWMTKHMPNIVEWLLVLANSILWGFVAAVPVCLLLRGRGKPGGESSGMPECHGT